VYQTLDHVQRHTLTAGVIYHVERIWGSVLGQFGSGLPTGPGNSVTLPSHLTFDLSLGDEFFVQSQWARFKLSADLTNVFDDVYPISIANGFNGSYYAAGRGFMIHLSKEI
jgi:outer membrane receptor protein involved in Fe transport